MIDSRRSRSAIGLILAMAIAPQAALAQAAPPGSPQKAPAAAPSPPPSAPPGPQTPAAAPSTPIASLPAGAPQPVDPATIALRPDQSALLRQALDQAASQGFADKAFTPPQLDGLLQSTDPAVRQRGEALLKTAVLRYAAAVHRGRLADSDFDDEWGLRPAAFDPAPGLAAALGGDRLAQWLASLPPPYAGYRQLAKVLADFRAIAARGGWQTLPAGDPVKPGAMDPRIPALRQRLAAENPAFQPPPAADDTLDPATDEALKLFQQRHALKDDGVLDKATLAALNVPVEARIDQIMANMERWRWLPDSLPAQRVQVNIAGAVMTYFKDDKPALSMEAAPGKPTDRTPMLMSQIRSIVLNPPWNIPADIARKETLPKARAHPGYLEREGIHIIHTANGGERLQQEAGPKSALGRVKFDFANTYGVYLHDTPERAAFSRASRLVSHGCVRLEKPRDLAALMLQGQGDWNPAKIDKVIDAGDTQRVGLTQPVAVFLLYWTAFVGPDGGVIFLKDAYNWDHELLQRISDQKYSKA